MLFFDWKSKKSAGGSHKEMGLEGKLFHKAKIIARAQEEAGLSDEQVEKVKQIQYDTQKKLIQQDAAIESLGLDIWHEASKRPPNLETIHQLIDEKYELKKAKSKMLMDAYLQVKEIPTEEQWKVIKSEKKF